MLDTMIPIHCHNESSGMGIICRGKVRDEFGGERREASAQGCRFQREYSRRNGMD